MTPARARSQNPGMATQHWERLGAASGIVAAILFGVSVIIFLGTDPSDLPDVLHAADYAEFVREHQDALKVQVLLNSLGMCCSCGSSAACGRGCARPRAAPRGCRH